MRRVWHHYREWEDWQCGFYADPPADTSGLVAAAQALLSDPGRLKEAMRHVAFSWPCAAEHNLSDPSRNHQAWLGQAACCYAERVPESVTRQAWWLLSEDTRREANAVADLVFSEWLAKKGAGRCQKSLWE